MAVPSVMADLSTTANSNSPAGTESPSNADDFLRAIQAIVRTTNAKGADIASATTTDIGAATGEFVDVTGTTTITGLGTVAAGIVRTVRFTGALTLTHNATSLILPGGANITTAANDRAVFRSLGSGNWLCIAYQPANGGPILITNANITGLAAETAPATDDLLIVSDTSEGAANKMTLENMLKVLNSLTADATPDVTADYLLSYDASASGVKKVLIGATGGAYSTKISLSSGSAGGITGIPSWAKKITVMFDGVTTTDTNPINIQIGTTSGYETTGYVGSSTRITTAAINSAVYAGEGYALHVIAVAASLHYGSVILTKMGSSDTWAAQGVVAGSNTQVQHTTAGTKTLGGTLDRVQVMTAGTFDGSGSVAFLVEG